MGKDASYYETLHNYHETLVKHSGVVKEEDLYVDNYQKDRFFIDAPNNQIVHASLHRIANGDARSWEITVSFYPFQLVRDARNVANSTAAFFHSLTTANCGVSIVDSTMESFLLLFTEYFMSMESNFEELTEQTYRGLCICTNCDHAPKPLKLTNKESIKKAVTGGEKAQESAALRTFIVTIEERVSQSFAVQAKNTEEAMEIANQKYDDGEFVIDSPKVTHRCMRAGDGFETTEWIEF